MKLDSLCKLSIFFGVVLSSCVAVKNVLFIIVDDLRPELEPYIDRKKFPQLFENIRTPNINELAKKSIVFHNAYVQYPLCAPSRASILTGRRPDTTRIYDFSKYFRNAGGNFTTIPQFYKNNGYHSVGFGKVFHTSEQPWSTDDISWTEKFWKPKRTYEVKCCSWNAIPDAKLKDAPLQDMEIADKTIEKMRSLVKDAKSGEKHFFLAAGFRRPHRPFIFPESFLDYYPEETIKLPQNKYVPQNMPKVAWHNYGGMLGYDDVQQYKIKSEFNRTLPDELTLKLRRAYYSAVSFVDSQVGRVLDELNNLELANDTVIVFWGDHGFHLGENGEWLKQTLFNLANHAPLMLSIPGVIDKRIDTHELVEHVDIFPTLLEATGHDVPGQCPDNSRHVTLCTEGTSLLPLVAAPDVPLKKYVLSQFKHDDTMGYSILTKRYRYSEWIKYNKTNDKINWNKVKGKELYDHKTDLIENINVVDHKEYKTVVRILSRKLREGWKNALYNDDDDDDMTGILKDYLCIENEDVLTDRMADDKDQNLGRGILSTEMTWVIIILICVALWILRVRLSKTFTRSCTFNSAIM